MHRATQLTTALGVFAGFAARASQRERPPARCSDARPWSVAPQWHDVSVLLTRPTWETVRPRWLDLVGARRSWPIPTRRRGTLRPCRVEARLAIEGDDAIPVDRYTFVDTAATAAVYLRPGRYRVEAFDREGHVLGRARTIRIR